MPKQDALKVDSDLDTKLKKINQFIDQIDLEFKEKGWAHCRGFIKPALKAMTITCLTVACYYYTAQLESEWEGRRGSRLLTRTPRVFGLICATISWVKCAMQDYQGGMIYRLKEFSVNAGKQGEDLIAAFKNDFSSDVVENVDKFLYEAKILRSKLSCSTTQSQCSSSFFQDSSRTVASVDNDSIECGLASKSFS